MKTLLTATLLTILLVAATAFAGDRPNPSSVPPKGLEGPDVRHALVHIPRGSTWPDVR
jgi:hypothetical protein